MKVSLQSSDNKKKEYNVDAVEQSGLISLLLQDLLGDTKLPAATIVPIPAVKHKVLSEVMRWCEKHTDSILDCEDRTDGTLEQDTEGTLEEDTGMFREWDEEFMTANRKMLQEIIYAASHLEITALKDLACEKLAKLVVDEHRAA